MSLTEAERRVIEAALDDHARGWILPPNLRVALAALDAEREPKKDPTAEARVRWLRAHMTRFNSAGDEAAMAGQIREAERAAELRAMNLAINTASGILDSESDPWKRAPQIVAALCLKLRALKDKSP